MPDLLPSASTGAASTRAILDIAIATVRDAGALVQGRFYTRKEIDYKDDRSIVTDVDVLAEQMIKDSLAREFPDIGFVGEEMGGVVRRDGLHWIVDPVDGTRNYAAGVPHFAINLALANGPDVVLGVTYDPMRDELFHAVKGEGAFLNGVPISISQKSSVAEGILGFDIGGMDTRALYGLKLIQSLWPGMQSLRIMGSAALGLAYAASGRVDIYLHHTMAPWDVAAGLLLVREAGGEVTDRLTLGPADLQSTGVVASSRSLLKELLRLTQGQKWYTVE